MVCALDRIYRSWVAAVSAPMKLMLNRIVAGVVLFAVVLLLIICFVISQAYASTLPNDAPALLPQLSSEIVKFWPGLLRRSYIAGVIEQESNWKIKARLDKPRELGVGLGQFTKAFNADGSARFDALTETKRLDKSLSGWSWRDPYNTEYQLRGVVLKLKANDRNCGPLMTGDSEVLACGAAQYNGGSGSTAKRIHLCHLTPGCDAKLWFGNLEYQTAQSTKRVTGYGESFAETNSKYPARVFARMPKYEGKL